MTQLSENWATLWEALAAAQPDHVAVVVGDRQLRWRETALQWSALCQGARHPGSFPVQPTVERIGYPLGHMTLT